MQDIKNVLIGIQARSANTRLPKKAFENIGGRYLLDRVIDTCLNVAKYAVRQTRHRDYAITVALLIPHDDPIKKIFTRIPCFMGDPDDVLSRYRDAKREFEADYICRVGAIRHLQGAGHRCRLRAGR